MATTSGRGQAGFAFRPGKDTDAFLALERNNARLAADEAYQAKMKAEKNEKLTKEFEQHQFKTDGLSLTAATNAQKRAKGYFSEVVAAKRQGNFEEKAEYFRDRQRSIQQDVDLSKSYANEVEGQRDIVYKNQELYNVAQVEEIFQETEKNLFNPDGSVNRSQAHIKGLVNRINSPENLNDSAVMERFAGMIEEVVTSQNKGLEDIEYKSKFAELGPDGNPLKDDNGQIKMVITPEVVSLMRKDEFANILATDKVRQARAAGNEQYTYTDAAKELLKGQQVSELKQNNKKPSNPPGDSFDPNSVSWTTADNAQYAEEIETDESGRPVTGYVPKEAMLSGLGLNNVTVIYRGEGDDEKSIKGEVIKASYDKQGKPVLKISNKNAAGKQVITDVPFSEPVYKQLSATLKKKDKKDAFDKIYQTRNSSSEKLYQDPKKTQAIEGRLSGILVNNKENAGSWFSYSDSRSSENLKSQIVDAIAQEGINISENDISSVSVAYREDGTNDFTYNNKTYNVNNISEFVQDLAKNNKKEFSVSEQSFKAKSEASTESTEDILP